MMYSGPASSALNYDEAPEVGAPILPYFQAGQNALVDTQKSVLKSYFEKHLLPHFEDFVAAAPSSHPDMRPLRQFIIIKAVSLSSHTFEQLLAKYYPIVTNTDNTFIQNVSFRNVLLAFNKLCLGEIDINHALYNYVFDPRYSPTKTSSPTKRNLVTAFLHQKLCKKFPSSSYVNDLLVKHALSWIEQADMPKHMTLMQTAPPSIECSPYSTDDEKLNSDDLESSEDPDSDSSVDESRSKPSSSTCKRLFFG
ncbi:hypothetical protein [Candidatus Berkiella aquae]|uniref:Uncharacterized protein n=1 Tax=Candidatus Berkiella aquae TaxID=295108 RepID=A0A0Q9YG64_9GAMM|nr:hypothetical protein [Candidatus Berkiella aquae]MCS5709963.1 hypothetical protein [Candidatus Berkiella aquae]